MCAQVWIDNLPSAIDHAALRIMLDSTLAKNGLESVVNWLKIIPSRREKCFALVAFKTMEAAEKAISLLNFTLINDQEIRLALHSPQFKQQMESLTEETSTSLFIRNLHPSITQSQLFQAYNAFGDVLTVKVTPVPVKEGEEARPSHALVRFASRADAETALKATHGRFLSALRVSVEFFLPKSLRRRNYIKVLFKNLPAGFTLEQVTALAKQAGELHPTIPVKMGVDTRPPQVRGGVELQYAVVTYADHDSAVKALELTGKSVAEGRTIEVVRHKSRGERADEMNSRKRENTQRFFRSGRNVRVRPLPSRVTQEELDAAFSVFGEIESSRLIRKENAGKIGYVCFKTVEHAVAAARAGPEAFRSIGTDLDVVRLQPRTRPTGYGYAPVPTGVPHATPMVPLPMMMVPHPPYAGAPLPMMPMPIAAPAEVKAEE